MLPALRTRAQPAMRWPRAAVSLKDWQTTVWPWRAARLSWRGPPLAVPGQWPDRRWRPAAGRSAGGPAGRPRCSVPGRACWACGWLKSHARCTAFRGQWFASPKPPRSASHRRASGEAACAREWAEWAAHVLRLAWAAAVPSRHKTSGGGGGGAGPQRPHNAPSEPLAWLQPAPARTRPPAPGAGGGRRNATFHWWSRRINNFGPASSSANSPRNNIS